MTTTPRNTCNQKCGNCSGNGKRTTKTCESPTGRTCGIKCDRKAAHGDDNVCDLGWRPVKAIKKVDKEAVMAFKFPALVARIQKDLKLSRADAEILFRDLLMFLYLCGAHRNQSFSPPHLIDEAWHTFIIFTQDYMRFCGTHFGYYLHHAPFTINHRPSKDGKPIRPFAYRAFGKLSRFWPRSGPEDCEQCAPSHD